MGVLDWLGLTGGTEVVPRTELDAMAETAGMLRESVADLELALDDVGYRQIGRASENTFTRQGLLTISQLCQTFAVANPLVKRGLSVRQAFVFGQGVTVAASATGETDDQGASQQDVGAVLAASWDDPQNKAAVTGGKAQERLERAHGTDGNVFIALFTNPRTGFVQMRTFPLAEVTDIITDPDDIMSPWYYLRQVTARRVADDGTVTTTTEYVAHPAVGFRPKSRPQQVRHSGSAEAYTVMWDAPVVHSKVNELEGWLFGIGDAYAALPWARLHRDFLRNWAVLMEALSQFAWKHSPKGQGSARKSQALRKSLSRAPGGQRDSVTGEAEGLDIGNPGRVGATVSTDGDLTAIPKSGATIDADSSKPLAAYVAAALGIPLTQLLADPGTTGARAVAETLDGPQQLEMSQRQNLWTSVYTAIADHIIRESVRAPEGALVGYITTDPLTGRETYELADGTPTTVSVTWPPLNDETTLDKVRTVAEAAGVVNLPDEWLVRRVLTVLGVEDIDAVVEDMRDANGQVSNDNAGDVAVQRFRQGDDPAEVLR